MNLGNLPGFYYDASKGKYFKIQANHAVPAEAKYAKSNVDREKREAKKRKLEERHDQIVRKQTVPAARLLKNPLLGGSGIRRVSPNLLRLRTSVGHFVLFPSMPAKTGAPASHVATRAASSVEITFLRAKTLYQNLLFTGH